MKIIEAGSLRITLTEQGDDIRAVADDNAILLAGQSLAGAEKVILKNFHILYDIFRPYITDVVTANDIEHISLNITFYFTYMYSRWRIQYPEANYSLIISNNDCRGLTAADEIIHYFKKVDKANWRAKSACLLDMSTEEFDVFYYNREQFYNK
ncbi:hypothetical protein [Flavobacterium subsaxonicum]|uniref:Uncharacterized protein n=1 Tax=Flavobacterium subsaxonicum WB 4.1-42 = DSM 21790 TaxID=1121898 RepID=A0A0A2MT30_9FLAO|nr:hypothetical protein [Flavobacterium subsaxonicum]KGO94736.1 hypothetical protein Q766_01080 [Flavobacterium subsaxonicum WB 4.1-42 = DSM 21790]